MKDSYSLNIGWLYPDLMNTYGDRGNVLALEKRCAWRNIAVELKKISVGDSSDEIKNCDLLFMGGAQDRQQEIVNRDLSGEKGKYLKEAIDKNMPGLFICGGYQFLGKYYKTADGNEIPGLGIFDLHTINPGLHKKRLTGNIVIESELIGGKLVGFENHGGRTFLGNQKQKFATVIKGYGNNGQDKTEGIIYQNTVGTYLHGPILPKNPDLTDWLIKRALEIKYKERIEMIVLNDTLETQARQTILDRI